MGRLTGPDAVTHTHKTVRRQFIDLRLPTPPPDDAEAFVVRDQAGRVLFEVTPRDFQQTIACLIQAGKDAGVFSPGASLSL